MLGIEYGEVKSFTTNGGGTNTKIDDEVSSIYWSSDLPGIVATVELVGETVVSQTYMVTLYERRYLCATTTVSWTPAQLNSGQTMLAQFPLTSPDHQEYKYRSSQELAEIFSITVHT